MNILETYIKRGDTTMIILKRYLGGELITEEDMSRLVISNPKVLEIIEIVKSRMQSKTKIST